MIRRGWASPDHERHQGYRMAALEAGVDYIATDEYEEFAKARARFLFRPSLLGSPGSK